MTDVFHAAARVGRVDLLSKMSRRDSNRRNEDGSTPTLLAACHGRLDALRILIGRGGNPNKCDIHGRSAIHLAAAGGHVGCVTFLVAFGANVWHLDNDMRTSLEVAALHNRADIVCYLDREMARQAAINKNTTNRRKERALNEAHRRIDQYDKLLAKAYRHSEKADVTRMQQQLVTDTCMRRDPRSLDNRSTSSQARMTSYFPEGSSMRKLVSGVGNAARKLLWKRSDSSTGSGLPKTLNASDFQHHPSDDSDSTSSSVVDAASARLFQRPGFGSLAFFQHAGTLVSFSSSNSSRETCSDYWF